MTSPVSDEFEMVTSHLVRGRDLNAAGHLFGGAMLSWIDEATAVHVMRKIGYKDFVTVAMDDIAFKAPGRRGDVITFYCRVMRTGRSSVMAETKAFVEDPGTGLREEVITCHVTYVCMQDGKTYPYFASDAYQCWMKSKQPEA